jgi:hypothetical protein
VASEATRTCDSVGTEEWRAKTLVLLGLPVEGSRRSMPTMRSISWNPGCADGARFDKDSAEIPT